MNNLGPNSLVADERRIQVVLDRMLDGYSVMISITEGELTRVLKDTTVTTLDEAEKIAYACAAENTLPRHKVAVVCR